jgi:translocation and assembly module TamA
LRRPIRALCVLLALASGCARVPFPGNGADARKAEAAPQIGVTVNGVGARAAANVRAHLSLAGKPCTTEPAYLDGLVRRAEGEALTAMRALGYYHARAEVRMARTGDCPAATVDVEPGVRMRVGQVEVRISGAARQDGEFMAALRDLPIATGQGLDHGRYGATRQHLEQVALERGYLDGRFVLSELRVDPARNVASAHFEFASGERYRIGDIRIRQEPQALREPLIRRFLEFTPDEPYEGDIIGRFYTALAESGYFDTIEVRPLLSAAEGQRVPIEVRLTPRKQHRYAAGLGVSSDAGIRSRFDYTNQRLGPHGHRLNATMRASLIEQRLSGEYRMPRRHPTTEWLSLQAGVRREEVATFDTVEGRIGAAETRKRPWDFIETRFVDLTRQAFDIGADSRNSTLLIPGLRWNKTATDDALYPTRGYTLAFEVRGAADALLSDVNFVRSLVSARLIRSLPLASRLLLRVDGGASWVDHFERLPPSERFFAGGDVSIRGYDYQDLGPEDAAGDVIGGRYLGVVSFELEKALSDRWGVATFVDMGNAFGGDGSATGIKVGIGAGLRWRSPVGPARIDLAHPLDDDTLVRVHLRIGPDL